MIPVSIRSRSPKISEHLPSSIESYEENKDMIFRSPLPDIVHPHKKEHDETIQRYDRLLEKMRATDEQLQILSRSWANNTQQRTSVSRNHLFYQMTKKINTSFI